MNTIDKHELFQHLSAFLKAKGVDLREGSYTRRIERGCGVLADAVNLSQQALTRTKAEIDKRLDQMRQVIHEKTAPKPPATRPQPKSPPNLGQTTRTKTSSRKSRTKKAAAPGRA